MSRGDTVSLGPDGNTRCYHDENSRLLRAHTGITDDTGQRIGTYTYDAQGRVLETQRAGDADHLHFSCDQGAIGAPQTTFIGPLSLHSTPTVPANRTAASSM